MQQGIDGGFAVPPVETTFPVEQPAVHVERALPGGSAARQLPPAETLARHSTPAQAHARDWQRFNIAGGAADDLDTRHQDVVAEVLPAFLGVGALAHVCPPVGRLALVRGTPDLREDRRPGGRPQSTPRIPPSCHLGTDAQRRTPLAAPFVEPSRFRARLAGTSRAPSIASPAPVSRSPRTQCQASCVPELGQRRPLLGSLAARPGPNQSPSTSRSPSMLTPIAT